MYKVIASRRSDPPLITEHMLFTSARARLIECIKLYSSIIILDPDSRVVSSYHGEP